MLILFFIKQNIIFYEVSDVACIEEPKMINYLTVLSYKQETVVSISIAWFGGGLKKVLDPSF